MNSFKIKVQSNYQKFVERFSLLDRILCANEKFVHKREFLNDVNLDLTRTISTQSLRKNISFPFIEKKIFWTHIKMSL